LLVAVSDACRGGWLIGFAVPVLGAAAAIGLVFYSLAP